MIDMSRISSSVVRIWSPDDRIVGAGFLVGDHEILTCAHVADDARTQRGTEELADTVKIDFPFVSAARINAHVVSAGRISARVAFSRSECDQGLDVAGLLIDEDAPPGASPARLVKAESVWGHDFQVLGFPAGHDRGEWAYGRMLDLVEGEWLQIEPDKPLGGYVRPGYSGTPVWDRKLGAATGMVVAADDPRAGNRVAYVIPAATLVQAWSEVLMGRIINPCPYRGLYSFSEEQCDLFFGREAMVKSLAEELQRQPIATLIAPSGSGKSSVIGAGLVPALRQSGSWLIVRMRPKKDPISSLSTALAAAINNTPNAPRWMTVPSEISTALHSGSIDTVADHFLEHSGCERMLVTVDQMEELFTLCLDEALQEDFVEILMGPPGARRRSSSRLRILLALRSDFEDKARQMPRLAECIDRATIRLTPISPDGLHDAIEMPAKKLGVAFEPGLVDRIIQDFHGQRGALPLLQFALTLLWEEQRNSELGAEAYSRLGGLQGALTRYADKVYEELVDEDQKRARRILQQLVGLSADTKDVRRPITEDAVRRGDWAVVQELAHWRLVVLDSDRNGDQTAELAHEELARSWDRLSTWIDQSITQMVASDMKADRIIKRFALTAGAFNLLPPPFDTLTVGATFARMGQQMADAYDVKLTWNVLRTSGIAMAEGIGAVAGGVWAGNTLLKLIPGVNVWVALLIQPPLVGAMAYSVGNTWKYVFHSICAGGKGPDNAEIREIVSINFRNRLRHLRKRSSRDSLRRLLRASSNRDNQSARKSACQDGAAEDQRTPPGESM